jgi:hypothetical protein
VEEALDMLISSHGEYCPLPLTMDVQAELFRKSFIPEQYAG